FILWVIDCHHIAVILKLWRGLAPAAIAEEVVVIVGRGRAVTDDEAVVERGRFVRRVARLPEIAQRFWLRGVIAGDARRGDAHILEELAIGCGVPEANADAGDIVVIGAETYRQLCPWGDGPERHTVQVLVRVVAQPEIFDVVVASRLVTADINFQDVRIMIVVEGNGSAIGNCKGNVGPVQHTVLPVILVPAFVDSYFGLIGTGRDRICTEAVNAIAIYIL